MPFCSARILEFSRLDQQTPLNCRTVLAGGSMTRYAAKVDSNQPAIVAQLRGAGFHVWPTHRLGAGFPDIVVTGQRLPSGDVAALLVEVKDGRGQLTADEREWHAAYPDGGPLIVARCAEDVLAWFGRAA